MCLRWCFDDHSVRESNLYTASGWVQVEADWTVALKTVMGKNNRNAGSRSVWVALTPNAGAEWPLPVLKPRCEQLTSRDCLCCRAVQAASDSVWLVTEEIPPAVILSRTAFSPRSSADGKRRRALQPGHPRGLGHSAGHRADQRQHRLSSVPDQVLRRRSHSVLH